MNKNNLSRRNFIKTGAISSGAIGAGALSSCNRQIGKEKKNPFTFLETKIIRQRMELLGFFFHLCVMKPDYLFALLFRCQKQLLPETMNCLLTPTYQEKEHKPEIKYWTKSGKTTGG